MGSFMVTEKPEAVDHARGLEESIRLESTP
jgi:hypothetical protein